MGVSSDALANLDSTTETSAMTTELTDSFTHPRVAESCSNLCAYSHDGECDDGGPGSDTSVCELGTDCTDCGGRCSYDECADPGPTVMCY